MPSAIKRSTSGSGSNMMAQLSATTMNALNSFSTISTSPSNSKAKIMCDTNTTELCLGEFRDFLSRTLSKEVDANNRLVENLHQCLELENLRDTLTEMEINLNYLMKSHPSLPTPVVGQLHTYLGLVYQEQNNTNSAVDSFMRAIWFLSRTPDDTLAIAKANHRLGLAYGTKKDYQQAMELIDRAIAAYDTSSELYVMAKEDRHEFHEQELLQLLQKSGRHTIRTDVMQKKERDGRANRRRSISGTARNPPARRRSFTKLTGIVKSVGEGLNSMNSKEKNGLKRQGSKEKNMRWSSNGGGDRSGSRSPRRNDRHGKTPPYENISKSALMRQATVPADRSQRTLHGSSSPPKKSVLMRQSTVPVDRSPRTPL